MRGGNHLPVVTRVANKILFKLQFGQSSDQAKRAKSRQQIEAQMSKSPMPLPQIRRRTSQQATRRTKRSSREVNQENPIARCNPTNQISSGIQNTRTALIEANLKPLIKKLRNRKQIEPKVRNQSNLSQGKAIRNSNSAKSTYLSSSIIPEHNLLL